MTYVQIVDANITDLIPSLNTSHLDHALSFPPTNNGLPVPPNLEVPLTRTVNPFALLNSVSG